MTLDVGALNVYLTLSTAVLTPDGHGGYTNVPTPLNPAHAYASMAPATQQNLERLIANTVSVQATHVVNMRFHPDVNTKTQIAWTDRGGTTHQADVTYAQDPDMTGTELIVLCQEIVP